MKGERKKAGKRKGKKGGERGRKKGGKCERGNRGKKERKGAGKERDENSGNCEGGKGPPGWRREPKWGHEDADGNIQACGDSRWGWGNCGGDKDTKMETP